MSAERPSAPHPLGPDPEVIMTTKTAPFRVGQTLIGPLFNEPMRVETVQPNGPASWVVGLVGTQSERFRKVTLSADEIDRLTILEARHSFAGDGRLLRLGLQAYALGIAYEFDQPSDQPNTVLKVKSVSLMGLARVLPFWSTMVMASPDVSDRGPLVL